MLHKLSSQFRVGSTRGLIYFTVGSTILAGILTTLSYLLYFGGALATDTYGWSMATTAIISIIFTYFGGYEVKKQINFASLLRDELQYDKLTGAKSRSFFFRRIEKTGLTDCVVVMVDVDRFKAVNDTYGHMLGDKVLARIGKVLTRTVRENDIVCRFGGEEFAILLHNISIDNAFDLTERLRQTLEIAKIWLDNGNSINVTASFGLAAALPSDTIDSALKRADVALYRAKVEGRNRVMVAGLPCDMTADVAGSNVATAGEPGNSDQKTRRKGKHVRPVATI